MCFSCGKAGHSATRCPTLDDTFHFMLPGWKTEKIPGGWLYDDFTPGSGGASQSGKRGLIRRGGGASPLGSVVRFDPRTRGGGGVVQHGSPLPGKELL